MYILSNVVYLTAVIRSNRKYKAWPAYRVVFWFLGTTTITASVALLFPDNHSENTFITHMIGHLLLGMLGPLLLVIAQPVTLALRTTRTARARRLTSFLRSKLVHYLAHPVTVSVIHIGGLWMIYATKLYSLAHHHEGLFLILHIHMFIAGYLFSSSFAYRDLTTHAYQVFPLNKRGLAACLCIMGGLSSTGSSFFCFV